MKILLVEDEPDIQEIARIALETVGGFTVETASSGKEGLAKAASWGPDLVLMDFMMPGMDGPTTFKALRESSEARHVPVIFMTAKVQPQEIAYVRSLGALGVIPKPFDPMKLASTIQATLDESRVTK